jgi:hypothetical protein
MEIGRLKAQVLRDVYTFRLHNPKEHYVKAMTTLNSITQKHNISFDALFLRLFENKGLKPRDRLNNNEFMLRCLISFSKSNGLGKTWKIDYNMPYTFSKHFHELKNPTIN